MFGTQYQKQCVFVWRGIGSERYYTQEAFEVPQHPSLKLMFEGWKPSNSGSLKCEVQIPSHETCDLLWKLSSKFWTNLRQFIQFMTLMLLAGNNTWFQKIKSLDNYFLGSLNVNKYKQGTNPQAPE